MLSRKVILITTGIILLFTFSACSPEQDPNRQVINVGGKKITVIKHANDITHNDIALQKINSIKEVRAFDWIDDNTVLISKENKDLPKVFTENVMTYPQNLYLYNLKTNKSTLIITSKQNMGNATLSPDKKHVFYKEGIDNLTGFILSLETNQKIQVTTQDSIYPTEGHWIDNDNVVFSTLPDGIIYSASTKGDLSMLANANGIISNTIKINNYLYYNIGEKLYKQEVNTTKRKLLREDVSWLIPSDDHSQFALVKHNDKTKRTLTLADLNGNELESFADGTQIMGTSWSSDGSKLAYTVAAQSNCDAGLFVVDAKSSKIVQLAVDIQYISDSVKWSPSGKRLLASNFITQNSKPAVTSYIIDLK
jgi:TolB protein